MDKSLASLFDDDNDVEDVLKRQKTPHSDDDEDGRSPRPAKRRRRAVGGSSDDDEATSGVIAPTEVSMAAMENLAGMDEDFSFEWRGAAEIEQKLAAEMKRSAPPPLTPHQIMPSSSPTRGGDDPDKRDGKSKKGRDGEEKKPRRKPVNLNEGLLVSDKGFPKLIKDVKDFKPKGKGHEATPNIPVLDSSNVSQSPFPRNCDPNREAMQDKDAHGTPCTFHEVTPILTATQGHLSRWKDEAKGVHTLHDPDSDDDSDDGENNGRMDEDQAPTSDAPSSSRAPSRPPTSASEHEDEGLYDEDLDALFRDDSQTNPQPAQSNSASGSGAAASATMDVDPFDNPSLWENFDDLEMNAQPSSAGAPTNKPKATNASMDEDWDIMDEIGGFDEEPAAPKQANPPQPQPTAPPPPEDDDMADFYV
ncbi:hypothetical protein CC1G_04196 [Coprinopsis cinerea okayama7|uniref:Uncharacterized protein n=1 Tax=Coprinopsis cinerea (strain Okayama-7 / 130 / ATCC MYA-4618 / FGSC 9003) TaxID=240176 RepID=A8NF76_COPC7|nr:hypothetical protein CC1G_04196 [Coprinopsis cinerea okayama7\|eukprot:XP_001833217.2 hypothetical protein CC1G_04196 [Coprinopsis cinerea okayama7\